MADVERGDQYRLRSFVLHRVHDSEALAIDPDAHEVLGVVPVLDGYEPGQRVCLRCLVADVFGERHSARLVSVDERLPDVHTCPEGVEEALHDDALEEHQQGGHHEHHYYGGDVRKDDATYI